MDLFLTLLREHGLIVLLGTLGVSLAVWVATHLMASSGQKVQVLWGLVEYTKGDAGARAKEGDLFSAPDDSRTAGIVGIWTGTSTVVSSLCSVPFKGTWDLIFVVNSVRGGRFDGVMTLHPTGETGKGPRIGQDISVVLSGGFFGYDFIFLSHLEKDEPIKRYAIELHKLGPNADELDGYAIVFMPILDCLVVFNISLKKGLSS